jgi:hypothetical protein
LIILVHPDAEGIGTSILVIFLIDQAHPDRPLAQLGRFLRYCIFRAGRCCFSFPLNGRVDIRFALEVFEGFRIARVLIKPILLASVLLDMLFGNRSFRFLDYLPSNAGEIWERRIKKA